MAKSDKSKVVIGITDLKTFKSVAQKAGFKSDKIETVFETEFEKSKGQPLGFIIPPTGKVGVTNSLYYSKFSANNFVQETVLEFMTGKTSASAPAPVDVKEKEEEEEEEEHEEEGGDDLVEQLSKMKRKALETFIKENELVVEFEKKTTDDELRALIVAAIEKAV